LIIFLSDFTELPIDTYISIRCSLFLAWQRERSIVHKPGDIMPEQGGVSRESPDTPDKGSPMTPAVETTVVDAAAGQADETGLPLAVEREKLLGRYYSGRNYPAFRVYDETDSFHRHDMPGKFHWSVVWADLMMTMFFFFAIMFVYQAGKQDTGTGTFDSGEKARGKIGMTGPGKTWPLFGSGVTGPVDPAGPLEGSIVKIFDVASKALDSEGIKDFASIDLASDRAMRIALTGDLFFDPGSAALKPGAKEALQKIGGLLQNTPYMINVAGHTDSVPIHTGQFSTNWELSVLRASAVARFLIDEMRIPAQQVSATGYAHYQPVGPNDTEKERARNRRVEIVVTKEAPDWFPADYRKLLNTEGGGR
jgi:chemotaxis protein MotB